MTWWIGIVCEIGCTFFGALQKQLLRYLQGHDHDQIFTKASSREDQRDSSVTLIAHRESLLNGNSRTSYGSSGCSVLAGAMDCAPSSTSSASVEKERSPSSLDGVLRDLDEELSKRMEFRVATTAIPLYRRAEWSSDDDEGPLMVIPNNYKRSWGGPKRDYRFVPLLFRPWAQATETDTLAVAQERYRLFLWLGVAVATLLDPVLDVIAFAMANI